MKNQIRKFGAAPVLLQQFRCRKLHLFRTDHDPWATLTERIESPRGWVETGPGLSDKPEPAGQSEARP
jgi:hypothetical protein